MTQALVSGGVPKGTSNRYDDIYMIMLRPRRNLGPLLVSVRFLRRSVHSRRPLGFQFPDANGNHTSVIRHKISRALPRARLSRSRLAFLPTRHAVLCLGLMVRFPCAAMDAGVLLGRRIGPFVGDDQFSTPRYLAVAPSNR